MSSRAYTSNRRSNEPYKYKTRSIHNSRDTKFASRWNEGPRERRIKPSPPNLVLRFAICNAYYRVTTDTLYYVFSKYGNVLRIVLFERFGVPNGMVEFETTEGATHARSQLNGFELFHGCNQLQIEYAWTEKLFVTSNNADRSWDYTIANIYQSAPQTGYPIYEPAVYSHPSLDHAHEGSYQNYSTPPADANYYNGSNFDMMSMMQSGCAEMSSHQPLITFALVPLYQPNVIMVTGLNFNTSNTEKLFNLMSLYGNVSRIQFLPNQQGAALVQMFDQMSAEYCLKYLDSTPIGSHGKLQVFWTNQNFQPSNVNNFSLPDGSLNYSDFTYSKNQRFLKPRPVYWIQPPSKIVRFYNMPPQTTKDILIALFKDNQIAPIDANVLPGDDESRTSRGLLEFSSIAQAVLAIMKCNNKEIKTSPKITHFLKLCFSSSNTLELKN